MRLTVFARDITVTISVVSGFVFPAVVVEAAGGVQDKRTILAREINGAGVKHIVYKFDNSEYDETDFDARGSQILEKGDIISRRGMTWKRARR